jgi:hypothetical protein
MLALFQVCLPGVKAPPREPAQRRKLVYSSSQEASAAGTNLAIGRADVAAPRSQKKRRTVDDLCQEEELRQTAAQPSQRSTPPPQEALLSVEPPALGSYKPPGAKSHRAPPNQQPPKQHREPALTPVTNATAASTRSESASWQDPTTYALVRGFFCLSSCLRSHPLIGYFHSLKRHCCRGSYHLSSQA